MKFIHTLLLLFFILCAPGPSYRHDATAKEKCFKFWICVNFKYEGMLVHSIDRFYVVTKFELPKLEDLRFTTFSFDPTCKHLNTSNYYLQRYIKHCKRIARYVEFYKKQIEYYNCTAHEILQNERQLILPVFTTDKRQKRGIIATALRSIASGVTVLAYEGMSSFIHHKRHKALHKAGKVIEKRTDMQCNRVYHLEDIMIIYGTYN